MRILILLSLFCIFFVSGLQAQTPGVSREFSGVDFEATPAGVGREFSGVDFEATPAGTGREFTGIDFEATPAGVGREFSGVDFIATSTQTPIIRSADVSVFDIRTPNQIYQGEHNKIGVLLENKTSIPCGNCSVSFQSDDGYRGNASVSFSPKSRETVFFNWLPKQAGWQEIQATLECWQEANPGNNKFSRRVEVVQKSEGLAAGKGTTKGEGKGGKKLIEIQEEER